MRWRDEVLHVAWKDLRALRWPLLAYVAFVVLGTAHVVMDGGQSFAPSLARLILFNLLGMLIVAMLVQADSPARPGAFWMTLPLRSGAVVGSKLLIMLGVLMVPPLIGQAVGLIVFDASVADLPRLLLQSAERYGYWLAFAALIAALTRDLRSFAVVLVGATLLSTVAGFVVMALLSSDPVEVSSSPGETIVLLGLLTAIVLYQYFTRRTRRSVVAAITLALFYAFVVPVGRHLGATEFAAHHDVAMVPEVTIEEARLDHRNSGVLVRFGTVGGQEDVRYLLRLSTVSVRMPDGSGTSDPQHIRSVHLNAPDPIAARGLRRLDEGAVWRPSPSTHQDVRFGDPRSLDFLGAGASLVVSGRIEAWRPEEPIELPVAVGADTVVDGARVRIEGFTADRGVPHVVLRSSTVDALEPTRFMGESTTYLLVNEGRREALELERRGSSGSILMLLLPGASGWVQTLQLESPQIRAEASEFEQVRVDDEWLRSARLVIVRWKQSSVGTVQLTVPPERLETAVDPRTESGHEPLRGVAQ
jgi:hypothetical protein